MGLEARAPRSLTEMFVWGAEGRVGYRQKRFGAVEGRDRTGEDGRVSSRGTPVGFKGVGGRREADETDEVGDQGGCNGLEADLVVSLVARLA